MNTPLNQIEFESEEVAAVFEQMMNLREHHMGTAMGLEFVYAGKSRVVGRIPVDDRNVQPFGLLHGGASVALAETLCSIGGFLNVDVKTQMAVGIEINANHLKSARSGWATGTAVPVRKGRTIQVWETRITDDSDDLLCLSRCTLSVVRQRL